MCLRFATRPISLTGSALLLGLASALVFSNGSFRTKAVAQPPAPVPDALATLNEASRAAYSRAKESALANAGPVILVEGDNLVLKKGSERLEVLYTPPIYHALKTFAHIPLALDVMTSAFAAIESLGDPALTELRDYRKLVEVAAAVIPSHGFDGEQIERQRKIVAGCLRFIDSVLETRRCDGDMRIAFTRGMTPLVMFNLSEAARAALDAMHRQVATWKAAMSLTEWHRVSVIVMGSAMPRQGNLAVQYFARLLNQPGEGPRITYAESLYDEPKALSLLATHLVDTQVGVDFFNDATRMHRDLQCDVASEYVRLLIDRP
jgi:hypothetical protein